MRKTLYYILFVILLLSTLLALIIEHIWNIQSVFLSRLKNADILIHSTPALVTNTVGFKKCFSICSIEKKSINWDNIRDGLLISNTTSDCVKNIHSMNMSNGKVLNNSVRYNYSCNRFITSKLRGRIGNQMFEVATLLGTAFAYDLIPIIPSETILIKYFNLPDIIANMSRKLKKSAMKIHCSLPYKVCNFSQQLNTGERNVSLYGFFQSWKYFYKISDIIKIVFKLKDKHLERAKQYLSRVSINGFTRVCFHIRRGDLISRRRLKIGYAIPDQTFFERARQFYLKKFGTVQFFAITEDYEWCRRNLNNVSITPFKCPGDDLALLSLCDHVVVTVGTFGWWGAWLSGGTTVYFDGIPQNGSLLELEMKKEDYYPPTWVGIH